LAEDATWQGNRKEKSGGLQDVCLPFFGSGKLFPDSLGVSVGEARHGLLVVPVGSTRNYHIYYEVIYYVSLL
jgi:hypothetical protein